jgi:DNA polymerase-3 subunit gamma/tau
MRALLERNCADEGVLVEPAVYQLVIRAGGGSARDTQSVLDQLLAGAGPEGVTYEKAVALLGVTDIALIDDVVDALAAGDGAAVYGTVDRLVEAGHDARRFASDLLDRLRDLLLLKAVPDAAQRGLVDAPGDQLARMSGQAERLVAATLSRFAEIVHTGMTEMRGTTAPRLLLELVCARMLLPAASESEAAVLHRLERLERRVTATPAGVPGAAVTDSAVPERPTYQRHSQPTPAPAASLAPAASPAPAASSAPAAQATPAAQAAPAEHHAPAAAAPADSGAVDAAAVRRVWSDLLAAVRTRSRSTEAMLSNATVHAIEGSTVVLTHTAEPLARRLSEVRNADAIADALQAVLGGQWQVRCVHAATLGAAGGGPTAGNGGATAPPASTSRQQSVPARPSKNQHGQAPPPAPTGDAKPHTAAPSSPPGVGSRQRAPQAEDVPPPPEPPDADLPPPDPEGADEPQAVAAEQPAARRDQQEAAIQLLTQQLGARKIDQR